MICYISLFSEIYLFVSFFFLFIFCIFINLLKKDFFPNIYKSISFLIIIFSINGIFIDIFYNNFISNSYDLYKTVSDVWVKNILLLLLIIFNIYSYFFSKQMKLHKFEYLIIIYFILINFILFIITIDLLSFYLLLEIQSLCFYLLTSFDKKNQYSVESGLKYFILSSFSSILLLFGFSIIYGLTGSLNLIDLNLFFSIICTNESYKLIFYLSSIFILIAFLFKLYVAPFHLWISDIYQGSPTITTAFFATISLFPLFYSFCKYFINLFYFLQPLFNYLILILSILSMILGFLGAIYQKKIKRLIAFSSITTIGYIFIGFLEENYISLSYSIVYLIIYIINTIGLFIIFLNLYLPKFNFFLERLNLLSGFIIKNKLLSFCITILFFSFAGIPPFSLFIVKILILTRISYIINNIILFIIIITAIISTFYYLRIIKYINFNKNHNWIYNNIISYINSILLLYIILFNIFFFLYSSKIILFSDYISIFLL